MAGGPHVLIVEARFYTDISDELARGAVAALDAAGATYERLAVPGALEIPAAIRCAVESDRYDGYVALGCIIRGDTSHYDYVCTESMRGVSQMALGHLAAIGCGILTCESREQAVERAAVDGRNKGRNAAEACLAMVAIRRKFGIAGP
ncbi:MAG: 6,7-dimethyl-8-ribityllumazine synthase [Alphaproteobacteria bacterium]